MSVKILLVMIFLVFGTTSTCPTNCLGLSGLTTQWGAAGCPSGYSCRGSAGTSGCATNFKCCPTTCQGISSRTPQWGARGCPSGYSCQSSAGTNGCPTTFTCVKDCPTNCLGLSGRTPQWGQAGCPDTYHCQTSPGTNGCQTTYTCALCPTACVTGGAAGCPSGCACNCAKKFVLSGNTSTTISSGTLSYTDPNNHPIQFPVAGARMIWNLNWPNSPVGETVTFTSNFTLSCLCSTLTLTVIADDQFHAYINGNLALQTNPTFQPGDGKYSWHTTYTFVIPTSLLVIGNNVLRVVGKNTVPQFGFVVYSIVGA